MLLIVSENREPHVKKFFYFFPPQFLPRTEIPPFVTQVARFEKHWYRVKLQDETNFEKHWYRVKLQDETNFKLLPTSCDKL